MLGIVLKMIFTSQAISHVMGAGNVTEGADVAHGAGRSRHIVYGKSAGERRETPKIKREIPEQLTRRKFLKDTCRMVGGITLASISLATACRSQKTANTSESSAYSSPDKPPSTKPYWELPSTAVSSIGLPIYSDPVLPYSYVIAPGCTARIAIDRKYSPENLWVKTESNNAIKIGISDHLQQIIGVVQYLDLPKSGDIVTRDSTFGSAECFKMNFDLISPVSGSIMQVHTDLLKFPTYINSDPYGLGWIMIIQPDNMAEDTKLLYNSDEYAMRTQKGNPYDPVAPATKI
jgi:glycine cleavage system H protein